MPSAPAFPIRSTGSRSSPRRRWRIRPRRSRNCCCRIPQFTGVTSTDGSRLLLVSRAVGARGEALLARLHRSGELHLVEVHGGDQPTERRRRARWSTSISDLRPPAAVQPERDLRAAVRQGQALPGRAARMGRSRRRRMADAGHLRRADRLAHGFRQHSVHRATCTTSRCRSRSGPSVATSIPAPASTPIRRSSSPITTGPSRRC